MHRPLLGTGMFLLYALSRPESLEQVDSSVRQILKDFQDKPVSDTELNLAKDKLKFYDASQVANKESQMLITGLNTLYKLPKNLTQKRQDWLQSITPKDIQTLAQKLFQNPQSAKGTPKK